MLRTIIAGQHLCSITSISFSSTSTCNKMYSRFVFSNFDNKNLNKRQRHTYGAFKDVFDGSNVNNLLWYSKKRIYQAKLKATEQNGTTDMVALLPRSSTTPLPSTSSANTADNDKSAPWNIPSSFVSTSLQLTRFLKNLLVNILFLTTVPTSTTLASPYI